MRARRSVYAQNANLSQWYQQHDRDAGRRQVERDDVVSTSGKQTKAVSIVPSFVRTYERTGTRVRTYVPRTMVPYSSTSQVLAIALPVVVLLPWY